jgi:exonuclease III
MHQESSTNGVETFVLRQVQAGPQHQRGRNQDVSDKTGHLQILQANVDVLTNKKDELLLSIFMYKPDIVCLQEVLPKNPGIGGCIPEKELKLEGYNMHCAELMSRGVITYVTERIPAMQVTPAPADTVASNILIEGKQILIINTYRSRSMTGMEAVTTWKTPSLNCARESRMA